MYACLTSLSANCLLKQSATLSPQPVILSNVYSRNIDTVHEQKKDHFARLEYLERIFE